MSKFVDTIGDAVGSVVEKTTGVLSKGFAVVKNFAATSSSSNEQKEADKRAKKEADKRAKEEAKKRLRACRAACKNPLPSPAAVAAPAATPAVMSAFGSFCAEPNPADCKSSFGAVGDEGEVTDEQAKMRLREASFRKAAEEAESGRWNSGTWDRVRKNTWSGQSERGGAASSAPVTYQQAILTQPIPMLSPLRGTNQPQGLRGIVDATMGTTTTTYNPNLPSLAVAIPSNASAGSLAAGVKVNIVGGGSASSFAAMFG